VLTANPVAKLERPPHHLDRKLAKEDPETGPNQDLLLARRRMKEIEQ